MDTQERELKRLRKELDAAKARIEGLEAELAVERGMLRAVFDATTDMFAMKGPGSVYRLVNPAFCQFLSKSEDEIVGRTDYDLFSPDDAAMYAKGDAEVMQTRQTAIDDWEVMGDNGKVWLQVIKTPVLDSGGKASGVFCSVRDVSSRKKSEQELERFFNLIPDLACIASAEGYFLKVNAAWEKTLGYTNDEMLSISFYELIHPEDREATKRQVERQCLGSGVHHFVNRYLGRDGSYRSLEWNATPADGATLYAVARDITERIENEKETRLWADAFRFCTHGIAIGLPLTNSILTCNEAFAHMRGQSVAEIEGSPIVSMYRPEERATVIENIQIADRSGSVRYESQMTRKDGTLFPVQMDVVSIADEEGHLLYRIATMQDITERQSSQLALRDSEARFRSAIESAPDGIFIQTGGRFIYMNPKALEMLGATSPEKVIGRQVVEFFHSDFKKIVAERIRTLNRKLQAVPAIEEKMLRIDGTVFDVEVSAVPFAYSGEHGALVFMRDITGRKRAEQERNMLERQLFQSQKIESIGRLAGGIAHDLNNLLTPILGYSEMLALRFSADDSRRQHLNVMHDAALRARDLIRQLLAFGGSQSLEFRALDLNAVLQGFEPLLRRTLRANVVMDIRFHDGVLPMQGDAGQLEQIIMNLAINADDSMPSGGLLTMETSEEILDAARKKPPEGIPVGRYVVFSARDTGIGMDSDTLAHVFEPFFTTKQKGKGTGLGLSTVYGIVRQHGGFIDVLSQPGEGTIFRIFFPYCNGGLKAEPLISAVNTEEKCHGIILVVEDDDMVRHFIVQTLLQEGFVVYEASCGEDALDILAGKTCDPDLLLTDLIMKGMNGKELYDKVKLLVSGIRVIYMSGYAKNIISSHGVFNKGISFLQKPFTIQGLLEKVRVTLNAQE